MILQIRQKVLSFIADLSSADIMGWEMQHLCVTKLPCYGQCLKIHSIFLVNQ